MLSIKLSFIILCWNSERYLEGCFTSIIRKCSEENIKYEIIVIDNGSHDDSRQIFDTYKKNYGNRFTFILLPTNTGTTHSRNLGLKRAKGHYICILDSDTEINKGKITYILRRLDDKKIGIVAPKLLLNDGQIQNSVKKFPTLPIKMLKVLNAVFKISLPDLDFYESLACKEEFKVDSAISACWFFRKDLLDEVGFLDEKIFYSPEDLDFSMRIRKAGKEIVYYPRFSIIHYTQHISHKMPFSKNSLSHFFGLIYYFQKHGGWFSNRNLPSYKIH